MALRLQITSTDGGKVRPPKLNVRTDIKIKAGSFCTGKPKMINPVATRKGHDLCDERSPAGLNKAICP